MNQPADKPPEGPLAPPLTGHSYDGIAEYDNPMPTWWRRTFWLTFLFSVGYFVHYQLTGNGASVAESYAEDMREFRELVAAKALGKEVTEEGLNTLTKDAALMKDGRTVFVARCVQCHADRGQGNIGPNLTDDYWLNGTGALLELYEIVSNGRTQKGMPNWSQKLRPLELAQVVAYVGTLRHTRLPGRAAQGSLVAPVDDASAAPSAAKGG
jgi:cytochrome c oxidase cbb3-type subunit 3